MKKLIINHVYNETDDQKMNLLMYCDSGYIKNIIVTLESFFEFHQSTKICFYAFGRKWRDSEKNQLREYLLKKKASFVYFEISDELKKIPYQNKQIAIFFSWIFAPRIIADEKVLCIDNDILFNCSIETVYNKDMGDDCVCGVLDWNSRLSKMAIGLKDSDIYINSGFKILNLGKLREIGFEKKAIGFIENYDICDYQSIIRSYLNNEKDYWKLMCGNIGYVFFHDQGTLAKVLQGRISLIDPKYNVTRSIMDSSLEDIVDEWGMHYSVEKLLEAKYKPSIIHFAGGNRNKPWKQECDHPYCDLYRYYAKRLGIDILSREIARKRIRKSRLLEYLPGFVSSHFYRFYYFKLSREKNVE